MDKITVKDVSFSYDKERDALSHVSFQIKEGAYTTIIGHNGSGKSTIAKLLIGLMKADGGSIEVDRLPLNEENLYAIRDKIGIVFQNPDNQFIGATVADDIAFGLENHQIPTESMQGIIETYAKKVHMEAYLESEPTKLSGGQKQRVAIAGVLAMKPEILIFDEATSMLDPQGRSDINHLIQEIHENETMTIISITHDIEEVAMSDHVIVLDQGKVVVEGHPSEILLKEKELIDLHLDIPFSLKVAHALQKLGIPVKECTTMEGMVDEICRYAMKD